MTPQRFVRSRQRGWRKPEGSACIDRSSRFGNPWACVAQHNTFTIVGPGIPAGQIVLADRHDAHSFAVTRFFNALARNQLPFTIDDVRARLAGLDLGCYCQLHLPCHVDVTLPVANSAGPVTDSILHHALARYRPR